MSGGDEVAFWRASVRPCPTATSTRFRGGGEGGGIHSSVPFIARRASSYIWPLDVLGMEKMSKAAIYTPLSNRSTAFCERGSHVQHVLQHPVTRIELP